MSLVSYLKKIKDDAQSVMLRDLKFKNFDRVEGIVVCSISRYSVKKDEYNIMVLNEN